MASYFYANICYFVLVVLTFLRLNLKTTGALVEDERLEEYYRRNHTWPAIYTPQTEGWKKINDRRFAQISQIENSGDRYEG